MRILYGVQGTGNGHISRCRSVAEALSRKGVQVDYLLSGRAADAYFDMQAFGSYRALPGLTFASRDGELDLWQTLKQNQPRRFWQDLSSLDLEGYDRVVSDFEPITAWAANLLPNTWRVWASRCGLKTWNGVSGWPGRSRGIST